MNYFKITQDNLDYYIELTLLHSKTLNLRDLLKISSFVVDRNTNSFIKCRASLGELLEPYLEKHE